jgi:16S rRNA (guanine527-N7)-methyltransferase
VASDVVALERAIVQRATALSVSVGPEELEPLTRYYRLLEKWNRRINLTALPLEGAPNQTLDRLLLEPIAAARFLRTPNVWFDLGSGGGSPAIPMKVAFRGGSLAMVESRARKAAFLQEAVREVGLSKATVLGCRIEELAADHAADLVTARAIRLDGPLLRVVSRLLSPDGLFVYLGKPAAPPFHNDELRFDGSQPLLSDTAFHIFRHTGPS